MLYRRRATKWLAASSAQAAPIPPAPPLMPGDWWAVGAAVLTGGFQWASGAHQQQSTLVVVLVLGGIIAGLCCHLCCCAGAALGGAVGYLLGTRGPRALAGPASCLAEHLLLAAPGLRRLARYGRPE